MKSMSQNDQLIEKAHNNKSQIKMMKFVYASFNYRRVFIGQLEVGLGARQIDGVG